jgi:uncharacterized membrane protein YdjX (TVP38/TMEM64 family)
LGKKKLLLWTAFILASLSGLYAFFSWDGERFKAIWQGMEHIAGQREELRRHVESWGAFAPFAFISLQFLQVVFAPLPGEASGVIGGFLFGQWPGLIYSTIGLTAGSMGAFVISRFFRRFIRDWLKRSDTYHRFEYLLERQGIFISFILFLIPGFPKDFLCYLLGLSKMPWQVFLVISTAGRIPGTILLTLQGAKLYDGNITGFLLALGLAVIVALPAWHYRERLYLWVETHAKNGDDNGGGDD